MHRRRRRSHRSTRHRTSRNGWDPRSCSHTRQNSSFAPMRTHRHLRCTRSLRSTSSRIRRSPPGPSSCRRRLRRMPPSARCRTLSCTRRSRRSRLACTCGHTRRSSRHSRGCRRIALRKPFVREGTYTRRRRRPNPRRRSFRSRRSEADPSRGRRKRQNKRRAPSRMPRRMRSYHRADGPLDTPLRTRRSSSVHSARRRCQRNFSCLPGTGTLRRSRSLPARRLASNHRSVRRYCWCPHTRRRSRGGPGCTSPRRCRRCIRDSGRCTRSRSRRSDSDSIADRCTPHRSGSRPREDSARPRRMRSRRPRGRRSELRRLERRGPRRHMP
jgi:hypothetical protein